MGEPGRQPDVGLEIYSRPRELAGIRALISVFAERTGFSENQGAQIALALDEALCNIINHGYDRDPDGRIWIRVWRIESEPGIRIVLEDHGRQVDPETIQSRDLDDIRPGGLGVHIIRETMDEVVYEKREDRGMRLTMLKQVGAADDSNRRASA